jgi:hypothetical protein
MGRYSTRFAASAASDWEPDAVPWLADFECSSCLQIGRHAAGCPNERTETTMDEPLGPLADRVAAAASACKIDGCSEPWLTRTGMYGHLCADHAAEAKARRATNGNGRPAVAAPATATLEQLDDSHELVTRARTIVALEAELSTLRRRLDDEVLAVRELLDREHAG